VAFGVLIRLGDGGTGTVPWIVNVGGPWVVLAFAAGWSARWRPAVSGVACLVSAVLAKYGVQVAQGAIEAGPLGIRLAAWGAAAVAIGAAFGTAGARARRGVAWPWLLVAAVLVAEAGAFLFGVIDGESAELRYDGQPAARRVFVMELAIAGAASWAAVAAAARTRRRGGAAAGAGDDHRAQ
jgi:hypothetical protein